MRERRVELVLPGRLPEPALGYGLQRALFEEVAGGARPATLVITPSTRHVGVTKRDTHRPGFREAVRAAEELGFPTLVRSAGGGATAADAGTFGFSLIEAASERNPPRAIAARYREASELALAALARLGVAGVEVGEVQDEFCPGDNSLRVGDFASGMKVSGIAQRVTRRATSVGGIVLVRGHDGLARVLTGVYGALDLPFRPESVGSLARAGYALSVEEVVRAFAGEGVSRYGAEPVELSARTLDRARELGPASLVSFGR